MKSGTVGVLASALALALLLQVGGTTTVTDTAAPLVSSKPSDQERSERPPSVASSTLLDVAQRPLEPLREVENVTDTAAPAGIQTDRIHGHETQQIHRTQQRKNGSQHAPGRYFWWLFVLYIFYAQVSVTDEWLVPAIEVVVEEFDIPGDVAGATLLALGCNGPELITNVISLFLIPSDVGVTQVVGTQVFNLLMIVAAAIYACPDLPLELSAPAFLRDCFFYALSILLLGGLFFVGSVGKWESLGLFVCAVAYAACVGLTARFFPEEDVGGTDAELIEFDAEVLEEEGEGVLVGAGGSYAGAGESAAPSAKMWSEHQNAVPLPPVLVPPGSKAKVQGASDPTPLVADDFDKPPIVEHFTIVKKKKNRLSLRGSAPASPEFSGPAAALVPDVARPEQSDLLEGQRTLEASPPLTFGRNEGTRNGEHRDGISAFPADSRPGVAALFEMTGIDDAIASTPSPEVLAAPAGTSEHPATPPATEKKNLPANWGTVNTPHRWLNVRTGVFVNPRYSQMSSLPSTASYLGSTSSAASYLDGGSPKINVGTGAGRAGASPARGVDNDRHSHSGAVKPEQAGHSAGGNVVKGAGPTTMDNYAGGMSLDDLEEVIPVRIKVLRRNRMVDSHDSRFRDHFLVRRGGKLFVTGLQLKLRSDGKDKDKDPLRRASSATSRRRNRADLQVAVAAPRTQSQKLTTDYNSSTAVGRGGERNSPRSSLMKSPRAAVTGSPHQVVGGSELASSDHVFLRTASTDRTVTFAGPPPPVSSSGAWREDVQPVQGGMLFNALRAAAQLPNQKVGANKKMDLEEPLLLRQRQGPHDQPQSNINKHKEQGEPHDHEFAIKNTINYTSNRPPPHPRKCTDAFARQQKFVFSSADIVYIRECMLRDPTRQRVQVQVRGSYGEKVDIALEFKNSGDKERLMQDLLRLVVKTNAGNAWDAENDAGGRRGRGGDVEDPRRSPSTPAGGRGGIDRFRGGNDFARRIPPARLSAQSDHSQASMAAGPKHPTAGAATTTTTNGRDHHAHVLDSPGDALSTPTLYPSQSHQPRFSVRSDYHMLHQYRTGTRSPRSGGLYRPHTGLRSSVLSSTPFSSVNDALADLTEDLQDKSLSKFRKLLLVIAAPVKVLFECTMSWCDPKEIDKQQYWWCCFLLSMAWLGVFSNVMVASVEELSAEFGLPVGFLGATLCAAGTSLPNVWASFLASKDGKSNMAIANALGSNIQNVFLALALPWLLKCWSPPGGAGDHGNAGDVPVRIVLVAPGLGTGTAWMAGTLGLLVGLAYRGNWELDLHVAHLFVGLYFVFVVQLWWVTVPAEDGG